MLKIENTSNKQKAHEEKVSLRNRPLHDVQVGKQNNGIRWLSRPCKSDMDLLKLCHSDVCVSRWITAVNKVV